MLAISLLSKQSCICKAQGRTDMHAMLDLQSHRSGLDTMVGCSLGVITASQFGSIDLWPETELHQAAEAAGFVLPSEEESYRHLARLHSGTYSPAYAVPASCSLAMPSCP